MDDSLYDEFGNYIGGEESEEETELENDLAQKPAAANLDVYLDDEEVAEAVDEDDMDVDGRLMMKKAVSNS